MFKNLKIKQYLTIERIVCILMTLGLLSTLCCWYVHDCVILSVEKTFEDGSSYQGEWLAGTMHGNGIRTFADGRVYNGEFRNGRMHGKGQMDYPDGSIYRGDWEDDLYHGAGIYQSPRQNKYDGVWRYGQLREGLLITEDWLYEGGFDDLLAPHGVGVAEYKDGRVYTGYWCNGYKQGLGKLIYSNGKVDFGYWDQGVLLQTGKKKFETGANVYGIDVSKHQGLWQWENLALYADDEGKVYSAAGKAGSELQPAMFVIIKATEGATIQDPHYLNNIAQARKGRMIKGSYHFMTTQSSIEEQISNFVSNAIVEKGDFPPVLDIEIPVDRMNTVGVDKVQRMALQWLNAIQEHYGVKPIIYTNDKFRRDYLYLPEFAAYDYWIARYNDEGPESGNWIMWQFTHNGRVRGMPRSVDINLFSGNIDSLKNYINKAWNKYLLIDTQTVVSDTTEVTI